ncbi:MAG: TaqI-like C-terminal specificity domain-containing protein, partial [Candidatus Thermoplasmatota archaeon]|nr:TaqI-like C-terminal specificity domain-containing protein [Candidatus Thermoplasmatota archaeon]
DNKIDSNTDKWGWFKKEYPAIANYLESFEEKAKHRYDKGVYWWELRSCDYYSEFEKPKIMLPDISLKGNFALDSKGKYYCSNTAYIIGSSDKYLLGILNSKLITFFYTNISSKYRGGYLRFIYQYMKRIPIKPIDKEGQKVHKKMVELVDKILDLNKQLLKVTNKEEKKELRYQTLYIDQQIDQMVYDLYGLTDEEIRIVEESLGER